MVCTPLSRSLLAALLSSSLAACSGADISDGAADTPCHPYDSASCLWPWPSSAFLADDPDTVTGLRVELPVDGMPININDIPIDPGTFERFDGFSPSGALLAAFDGGVSPEGLPGPDDLAASVGDDAPVLLVDVETGARIPVLAEADGNAPTPEEAALIIRPVQRLRPATRHVVLVRDTVRAADGGLLARPPGFETLLAGGSLPGVRGRRVTAGFDDVLRVASEQGVAADELALAWDFVTASDESLTADMLTMRDRALPAMGEQGELLGFEAEVVAESTGHVHRLLRGTYDAPSFLDRGEHEATRIVRDDDDAPTLTGTMAARFSAIVPRCVEQATEPVPVLLFGHGLFGSSEAYLGDRLLQEVADEFCVVMIAGDFIGLSERQLALAARAANDLNRGRSLTDMLGQSVVNFIALGRLARGPLRDSELLQAGAGPILDTERVYYMGASLGGIMGGTFMAYDPHIERGVLGVPGGAWSLLIERSHAWSLLQGPAKNSYGDQYSYQLLIALLAFDLERWDPITTATRVLRDPMPGTPAKQLFLYEAVNDSLVSNLSTEAVARTLGVPLTGPTVRTPYGLELADGPVASALTIYDEGVAPVPASNVPPASDNGTHSGVNQRGAVLRQIERFLFEGTIEHECAADGAPAPCDCTTGACD